MFDVMCFSWSLSTNVVVKRLLLADISGIEAKYLPFHTPVDQYGMDQFNGAIKNWLTPLGSKL
jgi:hypothetical protein